MTDNNTNTNINQTAENAAAETKTSANPQQTQTEDSFTQMPGYGYGYPNGYMPFTPPPVKPKIKTQFSGLEMIYSFLVFALSFLIMRFAVFNVNGYITTAVYIIVSAAAAVFMKKSGMKFTFHSRVTLSLQVIFSAVYSITANTFIKTLNTMFLMILMLYLLYQLSEENQRMPRFLPIVLFKAAFEPFSHFSKQPEAAVQSVKRSKLGTNIGFILIGLLIAVPVTAIVGSLLMSADKGVEEMLGSAVKFLQSDELRLIFFQLVFAIPLSLYIFAMLFSNAHKSADKRITDEGCEKITESFRKLHNAVLYTAVTPICVLYMMFFISQISYFTSAFAGNLPDGYSFAEYARRGFFELLAIAVINLGVIILINLTAKKSGGALKAYTIIISFFTLVIIASALSKMVLYVSTYGLTSLRVYTSWFMVLCALLFIMVIIRNITDRFPLTKAFSAAFVIMFAALAFSRPDYLIIKYNDKMNDDGKLPHYSRSYALELSEDAYAAYLEDNEIDCSDSYVSSNLKEYQHRYKNDACSSMNISSAYVKGRIKDIRFPETSCEDYDNQCF